MDPEQAVLGAVLVEPDSIASAVSILAPTDFSKSHHAKLFEAMTTLHEKGLPIDPVSLTACFNGRGDAVGKYIGQLVAGLPRVTNLTPWAQLVKAESVRRQSLSLTAEITRKLSEPDSDPYDTLQELASQAVGLGRTGRRLGWLRNEDLGRDSIKVVESRINSSQGIVGLSTGLQELDGKLQGLRPGQLIGIGGRPGSGKTSLCQQIAKHVSKSQRQVAFFSLEMTAVEVTEREIASEAEVNLSRLYYLRKDEQDEQMTRITRAASSAMTSTFHKTDGVMTVEEIEALSVECAQRWGLDLIVIDYFQMVKTPVGEKRHEALTRVSTSLKQLAMKLKVPVVMAMQLNRNPEARSDRRPSLGDISYCDAPAMDCHAVILIHQPPRDSDKPTELIVDKNRSGFAGVARCKFLPELTRFVDQ